MTVVDHNPWVVLAKKPGRQQHDEWAVVRRYMSAESLAKARLHVIDCEAEEVTEHDLAEVSQTSQPKLTW